MLREKFKEMLKEAMKARKERATGTLRAEATLPPDMRARVLAEDKGDFAVPVRVTDEAGIEPIKCQMVWAWIPKKK